MTEFHVHLIRYLKILSSFRICLFLVGVWWIFDLLISL